MMARLFVGEDLDEGQEVRSIRQGRILSFMSRKRDCGTANGWITVVWSSSVWKDA